MNTFKESIEEQQKNPKEDVLVVSFKGYDPGQLDNAMYEKTKDIKSELPPGIRLELDKMRYFVLVLPITNKK